MALPATVTLIPIEGTVKDVVTGEPAQGYVLFRCPVALCDITGNVVMGPGTFKAELNLDGELAISLPATDDPDLSPVGWKYEIQLRTNVWTATFKASVPVATQGALPFAVLLASAA